MKEWHKYRRIWLCSFPIWMASIDKWVSKHAQPVLLGRIRSFLLVTPRFWSHNQLYKPENCTKRKTQVFDGSHVSIVFDVQLQASPTIWPAYLQLQLQGPCMGGVASSAQLNCWFWWRWDDVGLAEALNQLLGLQVDDITYSKWPAPSHGRPGDLGGFTFVNMS